MANNNDTAHLSPKDSIHKIWKFKSITPLVSALGMQKVNLLDLTNKDSLTFLTDEKEKLTHQPYKIIGNAIILENQNKDHFIEYIITGLTVNELRLIVHATFVSKSVKTTNDLCELIFEAEEQ
jgi:hypothetical protein